MLVKQCRVTVDQNASSSNGGQQQTMVIRDVCPQCKSAKYKKNGHTHNGKQNHHCHDCGRQFVQCCEQYLISDERRALIKRLLVERISLRGICRAVGVTLKWLLGFLVQCFEALPEHLHVQPVTCNHNVMIQRLEPYRQRRVVTAAR
jgi:transposase-like protein